MQACEEKIKGESPIAEVRKVRKEVFGAKLFRIRGGSGFVSQRKEDGEEGVEREKEPE